MLYGASAIKLTLISYLGLDSQGDRDFTILLPQLLECLGSQAYARKKFKGAAVWLVTWVEVLAATPATQRVYVRGPDKAAPPLPAQGGQDGARCPSLTRFHLCSLGSAQAGGCGSGRGPVASLASCVRGTRLMLSITKFFLRNLRTIVFQHPVLTVLYSC